MQLHLNVRPTKQRGAFLVVAIIMLLVLSSLGVALMSMAVTASRTSRNYSDYVTAHIRAISMAGYAQRIIESYATGQYPGPGTCTDSASCNVIDNTFPRNGKPILPWNIGTLSGVTLFKGSENNTWWTDNSFAYESTFAGNGNARVIVELLNTSATYPYTNTYRIVGYSTSNDGTSPSTSQIYTTWDGFYADPFPSTSGSSLYATSICSGGCPYGQCCSGGTCGSDEGTCEAGTETYVPPGWSCAEYFVSGLGYDSSTCANQVAIIFDGLNVLRDFTDYAIKEYEGGDAVPPITYKGTTFLSSSPIAFSDPPVSVAGVWNTADLSLGADDKFLICTFIDGLTSVPGYVAPNPSTNSGGSRSAICMKVSDDGDSLSLYCGSYADTSYDIQFALLPVGCNCSNVAGSICP